MFYRDPICINCNDAGCEFCNNPPNGEGKKMFCPDCGGRILDGRCDTCGLSIEDMQAAADFLDDYEPTEEELAEYYGPENDGQPSEYEEWQDVYGGDVEEYGTFGDYDNGEW